MFMAAFWHIADTSGLHQASLAGCTLGGSSRDYLIYGGSIL